MSDLISYVRNDLGKEHVLITGRATTALHLLLRQYDVRQRGIVIPVNICYSIVNAITMTTNHPVFVDIDPIDGNTRLEFVQQKLTDDVFAVVVPHSFGEPCPDILAIAEACQNKSIYLIEDCAAGVGGMFQDRPLGSFADFALFSFGSGKTLDASLGGALASEEPLLEAASFNERLPFFSDAIAEKIRLYSALYREIYNSEYYEELLPTFASLNGFFAENYLFQLRDDEIQRVEEKCAELDSICTHRRKAANYYRDHLPFCESLQPYPFSEGSVPWRYNLVVKEQVLRKSIINHLLHAHQPVSKWYPPIHRLFGDASEYPNATQFAAQILNIPLDVEQETVDDIVEIICRAVNSFVPMAR